MGRSAARRCRRVTFAFIQFTKVNRVSASRLICYQHEHEHEHAMAAAAAARLTAVDAGNVTTVARLLSSGCDPNAELRRHIEILRLLLMRSADANTRGDREERPLLYAIAPSRNIHGTRVNE
ncbi:hypothetical protein PINS_up014755 [Pythium insidiosum]|nr:hypothetical protein PINS_up014755 [Pythium insidiosum]